MSYKTNGVGSIKFHMFNGVELTLVSVRHSESVEEFHLSGYGGMQVC